MAQHPKIDCWSWLLPLFYLFFKLLVMTVFFTWECLELIGECLDGLEIDENRGKLVYLERPTVYQHASFKRHTQRQALQMKFGDKLYNIADQADPLNQANFSLNKLINGQEWASLHKINLNLIASLTILINLPSPHERMSHKLMPKSHYAPKGFIHLLSTFKNNCHFPLFYVF